MLFTSTNSYTVIPEETFSKDILLVEDKLKDYANTGIIESYDGFPLAYEYFLTENAKASIILLHGFTEFYKKLYEMAWYFINMGYNVFMYDQRDHGLSGRTTNDSSVTHIDNFNTYACDLEYFVNKVVVPNSNDRPIHIMGHSMGGAVTLLYLMKENNPIKKAILSSPMVSPKTYGAPAPLVRMSLIFYGLKNGWDKKFPFSKDFNPNPDFTKSSDSSAARFFHNLDYRKNNAAYQNASFTSGWLNQALKLKPIFLSKKKLSKIKAQTIIFSANNDSVVHSKLHHTLAKKLSSSTIVTMPGAKHTVYTTSGPVLDNFYKTVFNFLEE